MKLYFCFLIRSFVGKSIEIFWWWGVAADVNVWYKSSKVWMMYKAKCAAVNAENPCVQLWNLDNMWGLFKVALWNALDPLTCFLVSLKCVYLGTTLLTKYDHKFPRRNKEIRFVFIISTLVRSMIYQIDSIKPAYKLSPLVWYITREKKSFKNKKKKEIWCIWIEWEKKMKVTFYFLCLWIEREKRWRISFLAFLCKFYR